VMALRHLKVRAGAFVSHIVRPVVAAAVMAGGVLAVMQSIPDDEVVWVLMIEVAVGAIVYTAVLFVAWLGAGRPDGPEADAVQALRRIVARA
jgi:hypothetical protein